MPHPLVQKNGHGAGLVAGNARSRFETGPETQTVGTCTWVPAIGTLNLYEVYLVRLYERTYIIHGYGQTE